MIRNFILFFLLIINIFFNTYNDPCLRIALNLLSGAWQAGGQGGQYPGPQRVQVTPTKKNLTVPCPWPLQGLATPVLVINNSPMGIDRA